MNNKYSHLLSPIKIRNVVLKNRMLATNSLPHFLQGPEAFPTDTVISFYAERAKNGAAIVTVRDAGKRFGTSRNTLIRDIAHMPMWDISDPSVQNYICQMADAIHFYDSKVSLQLWLDDPQGYNISEVSEPDQSVVNDRFYIDYRVWPGTTKFITEWPVPPGKEIPVEMLQQMIGSAVTKLQLYQSLGFDMVSLYGSYHNSILSRSLSPIWNKRTDKYGGNHENRARFMLELGQAIKKACGDDFLVELQISGEENMPGGYKLEDTVEYARLWEGTVDILQFRGWNAWVSHPTGFDSVKKYPITLRYAEAIKESGAKIITAPNGGFQDLDLNEEYIATGKTDMIAMARAFICDPEYGKKAYEGRSEDVTPCIRCNKCHVPSITGHWFSICSVNPKVGIAHKVDRMVEPVGASKKVAVIGGGPAGMRAAIVAAERGHKVTLYEKNHYLGGQLRHADFASFKWPLRDFKDWLICQMDKKGVDVRLSTEATPEMIKEKGYDAVLVAAGAEPVIPDISGADSKDIWKPLDIFGNEKALGKNVVIVGGGSIGVETGMHLAENGHEVTVLEMLDALAYDATPIHYIEVFKEAWEKLENFKPILKARCNGIESKKVTYIDAKGKEQSLEADSVVLAVGMKPKSDLALKFYGSADRFFIIGDCRNVGSVETSQRTAFAMASQL